MIALDIFAAALVIAMLGAMLNEDTRDSRVENRAVTRPPRDARRPRCDAPPRAGTFLQWVLASSGGRRQ